METSIPVKAALFVVLFFIVSAAMYPSSNTTTSSQAETSQTTNYIYKTPVRVETSKAMMVTYCERAVTPQLTNPRSFSVDMHQTEVFEYEGSTWLRMFYYAQNGFGAEVINEAFCEFSPQGYLINMLPGA